MYVIVCITELVQCILGYLNLDYLNSQNLVNFHEFHYNLQDGGHLCNVICISTTCMLLIFFTLTEFMLVLMLEVQTGCNGNVDTCI